MLANRRLLTREIAYCGAFATNPPDASLMSEPLEASTDTLTQFSEIAREGLLLSLRLERLKQQQPALSARPTRAERRAFSRWQAKVERIQQDYERLQAAMPEPPSRMEEP